MDVPSESVVTKDANLVNSSQGTVGVLSICLSYHLGTVVPYIEKKTGTSLNGLYLPCVPAEEVPCPVSRPRSLCGPSGFLALLVTLPQSRFPMTPPGHTHTSPCSEGSGTSFTLHLCLINTHSPSFFPWTSFLKQLFTSELFSDMLKPLICSHLETPPHIKASRRKCTHISR